MVITDGSDDKRNEWNGMEWDGMAWRRNDRAMNNAVFLGSNAPTSIGSRLQPARKETETLRSVVKRAIRWPGVLFFSWAGCICATYMELCSTA
jgi:hypothetical protein